MSKKPRGGPNLMEDKKQPYEVKNEFNNCSADDPSSRTGRCPNIISHWAQPIGYNGPIYCRRHAYLARKK